MKKFVAGLLCGAAIMLSTSVFADGALKQITAYLTPDVSVEIDGQKVALQNAPVNYEGNTYLPVRELAGVIGLAVDWDNDTRTAKLKSGKSPAIAEPSSTTNAEEVSKPIVDNNDPSAIIALNGVKFIQPAGVMKLHEKARFEFNPKTKTLSLYLRENNVNVKVLIENVPYTIYNDLALVDLSYYEDQIKPLF